MSRITGLFILLMIISSTKQFNLETCRYSLGIETGKIPDLAFSSSSHTDENSVAWKARIRSETDGWCPMNKISSKTDEYIQIDLQNLTVITLIELQGKYSLKPNEQYADAFRIEYRRDKEQKWIKYKDFSEQYILSGNSNSYIPTIRDILPSIIAREIRIIPIVTGPISRHICMRLELYGCLYEDGVIAYSMAQGDKRGYNVQFLDETFDGENDHGLLKDGLGQLTDGIIADNDYRSADAIQGIGPTGYDWVGWQRKSPVMSNINIIFHFDTVRNFTSIRIHTSNLFLLDIYLFHSISISNCKDMNNQQRYFVVAHDYINTSARLVHIAFTNEKYLISDCLNVIMTFDNRSQWILISEVQFDSVPIPTYNSELITMVNHPKPSFLDDGNSFLHYWHWLFFALSLLILFIVLLIFIYINWVHTYQQHSKLYNLTNPLKYDSSYRSIPQIGCCANNSDTSCVSSLSKNDIRHHLMFSSPDSLRSMTSSNFTPTTLSTIYQSNIDSYLTAVSNDTTNLTTTSYFPIDLYANVSSDSTISTDVAIKSIQGPCGNSTYEALSSFDNSPSNTTPHVNDDQVVIKQLYSTINGCFGSIFQGYIYLYHSYKILKPVLIKTLTTNDTTLKELFAKEHELLSQLTHLNLVQFYGLTTKQNYAIIEHSDLGDLHTYLLASKNISKNIRLYIITQLSNALRYLESHNIIHRDIAARNCLIYENFQIKLTNTAIICERFQAHYYKINHNQLPIRWMAPECLINNQFTSQSDIWSFGITLWEVTTNCLTLPYSLFNDEEVYQRLKSLHGLHLSKPECLSKELIDLMLECWRPCNERPTFQEIYNFFNKRLYGVNIV